MSCDTAQMGADQAVPADKQSLVCASMPLSSPTSIWIRACSSSSRDQQTSLPFRRRHTHNAAPPPRVWRRVAGPLLSIARTKQRGPAPSHAFMNARFSSFMKCLWHIGCTDPRHIALCSAPLRVLHRRLPWPTHHHHHHHHHEQQQMQMRPSPPLACVAALPPVGCDCCCCVVVCCTASLDCSSSSC